jgi:hypothetical protein
VDTGLNRKIKIQDKTAVKKNEKKPPYQPLCSQRNEKSGTGRIKDPLTAEVIAGRWCAPCRMHDLTKIIAAASRFTLQKSKPYNSLTALRACGKS